MPKPTKEQLDDEEKRSTPHGFFNFAETYRNAAKALHEAKAEGTHKESPLRFLYYHAIELYLKAFLLAQTIHPFELRTKFGHDVIRLSNKAERLGLRLTDEDKGVFILMSETDAVIRSRYLITSSCNWPSIPELERICENLRTLIAQELARQKLPVRL